MTTEAAKKEMRNGMRATRRDVSEANREAYSRRICETLCSFVITRQPTLPTIAAYLATEEEIDIDPFIVRAQSLGSRIAVPRYDSDTRTYIMAELACDPAVLPKGHWSIREPEACAPQIECSDIDLWIVPGLAFTEAGARLGYGGGYYDRFLVQARPDSLKLGVAYPFQILTYLPADAHDIALDKIIYHETP